MFRNYLAVALRNIIRNKLFSFVNILGLSLGIASALLIFLWMKDEMEIDQYHEKSDRLYRVMENQKYSDGRLFTFSSTPGPMAPFIKDKFPEIELASRVSWTVNELFEVDGKSFFQEGRFVDPDFLNMVSLDWVSGDLGSALDNKNSIVISRSMAEKFFGNTDPVGKVMLMNRKESFTVTGVFEDQTDASSWKYAYVLPFQFFWDENKGWLDQWGNNNIRTWVLLAKDADPTAFAEKLKFEVREHEKDSNVELFIQRLGDAYLYGNFENGKLNGGRIDYVRIFFIVAIFVLLIACINFMNLSTAQASKRAKEVGLRKVIGAFPRQLFKQFMGESFLMVLVSAVIAILLVFAILPLFNDLTGKQLGFELMDRVVVMIFVAVLLGTAILAGTYPAIFVSDYKPVEVLKGQLRSGAKASIFRKVLVVVQFSLSIILIISTIVVFRQMRYMETRDIGFDRNNLFYVWMQGDMYNRWDSFREQLTSMPGIEAVTASGQMPIDIGNSTYGVEWDGKKPDDKMLFTILTVDHDFISTMKMEMQEGRAYDRSIVTDSAGFLVNEVAAKKFGFSGGAVDQRLKLWGREGKILGVVKDFNFGSLHSPIEPLIIRIPSAKGDPVNCLLVRAKANETQTALSSAEKLWKDYAPGYPYAYNFLSQDWEDYYKSEGQRGKVFNALTILSIFISCLGLFGLSAFSAALRTKELGIRKVLGASVPGLLGLMGKEFVVLVLLAGMVGCPVGWYIMNAWLSNYAFHIEVGWLSLVVAALACLSVSLLTVVYHSLKVSTTNPINSLRYE
jgi:ABC-type antimicrobial peptide transport system permease subunit